MATHILHAYVPEELTWIKGKDRSAVSVGSGDLSAFAYAREIAPRAANFAGPD